MHINEVHHAQGNIPDRGFGDALETWKEIWWAYFQHFEGNGYLWQRCQPVKKSGKCGALSVPVNFANESTANQPRESRALYSFFYVQKLASSLPCSVPAHLNV